VIAEESHSIQHEIIQPHVMNDWAESDLCSSQWVDISRLTTHKVLSLFVRTRPERLKQW